MSLNSPFSSFSFFFLSCSLTWEKCLSHRTEACSSVYSIILIIDETESWQFLSFLKTFNFSIRKNCRRKTVFELYLSLTGFQFSDFFLSFLRVSDFSQSWLYSACCSNAGFCPNWRSPFKFLLRVMAYLAQRACGPIIRFSSPTTLPSHATGLTLISFVQQTKRHGVQRACPLFPQTF